MADAPDKERVDKWLWHARFFKTRSLATKQVAGGHVRLNGNRIPKASQVVVAGDTLTFAQALRIKVVEITAIAVRRGPAPEAQALYNDLTPVEDTADKPDFTQRLGRPSKQDRRTAILLKGSYLE